MPEKKPGKKRITKTATIANHIVFTAASLCSTQNSDGEFSLIHIHIQHATLPRIVAIEPTSTNKS